MYYFERQSSPEHSDYCRVVFSTLQAEVRRLCRKRRNNFIADKLPLHRSNGFMHLEGLGYPSRSGGTHVHMSTFTPTSLCVPACPKTNPVDATIL